MEKIIVLGTESLAKRVLDSIERMAVLDAAGDFQSLRALLLDRPGA